jgi:DNA polymerase III alpha subunit (gram-positive type)
MKLVVLDTETTGLRAYYHEMVSFAGIKLDKNLQEIDRLVLKIKPKYPERSDKQALRVNGYSASRWENAIDPIDAGPKIAAFMCDCIPVAHNWAFDRGFILALFKSINRQDLKITRRGIDTIALSIAAFGPYNLKSYSLDSIGQLFGWPKQIHRAEADAVMCLALFRTIYPTNVKTAIKINALMLYAKIRGFINPFSNVFGLMGVGSIICQI